MCNAITHSTGSDNRNIFHIADLTKSINFIGRRKILRSKRRGAILQHRRKSVAIAARDKSLTGLLLYKSATQQKVIRITKAG